MLRRQPRLVEPDRIRRLVPETATLAAVCDLRVELLYAAVIYGTCSVVEVGQSDVAEWLGWLDWVRHLVGIPEAGEPAEADPPPEWFSQAVYALEHVDEARADRFDQTELRRWAHLEFERLAERARPLEQLSLEPLAEIEGEPSQAGTRLLALMQDSLVLLALPDGAIRNKRADSAEVLRHLVAARQEGVWDLLTK